MRAAPRLASFLVSSRLVASRRVASRRVRALPPSDATTTHLAVITTSHHLSSRPRPPRLLLLLLRRAQVQAPPRADVPHGRERSPPRQARAARDQTGRPRRRRRPPRRLLLIFPAVPPQLLPRRPHHQRIPPLPPLPRCPPLARRPAHFIVVGRNVPKPHGIDDGHLPDVLPLHTYKGFEEDKNTRRKDRGQEQLPILVNTDIRVAGTRCKTKSRWVKCRSQVSSLSSQVSGLRSQVCQVSVKNFIIFSSVSIGILFRE